MCAAKFAASGLCFFLTSGMTPFSGGAPQGRMRVFGSRCNDCERCAPVPSPQPLSRWERG